MTDSEANSGPHPDHDGHGDRDVHSGHENRSDHEATGTRRRLPLSAAVLLADVGIAFVACIALIVISVQRYGDSTKSSQTNAYVEALVVIFVVAALFATAAALLLRSGHSRVGAMQSAVAVVILTIGVYASVAGRPSAHPIDTVPVEQITDDNVQPVVPPTS